MKKFIDILYIIICIEIGVFIYVEKFMGIMDTLYTICSLPFVGEFNNKTFRKPIYIANTWQMVITPECHNIRDHYEDDIEYKKIFNDIMPELGVECKKKKT
jgi:hypothetical protein